MRLFSKRIPLVFYMVLVCVFAANIVGGNLLGLNVSGLAWFVALLFAGLVVLLRSGRIAFPFMLWLPWALLLLLYLSISDRSLLDPRVIPLQRTLQLLTPLVVAMAAATYRPSPAVVRECVDFLRLFAVALAVLLLLSGVYGAAASVMTCLLLGMVFINRYFMFRQKRDLQIYLLVAVIPVLAVTRMVTLNMLLCVPMSFAKLGIAKRVLFIGLFVVVGLAVFQLPQIQKKMFFSGSGEISDISLNNPDFATSGRSFIWEVLWAKAQQSPWLGHGTGAGETMTYSITPVGYPHNDWLLTLVDYGWLGVGIFLLCNLLMMFHCLAASRKTREPETRFLFIAGASSFPPFFIVMFTDNIMVYASFFGILQYVLIGLAFGALKHEQAHVVRAA